MIHIKFTTTNIDIEADIDPDKSHLTPDHSDISAVDELALDANSVHKGNNTLEWFKHKWGIVNLQRLGSYHCQPGYTDFLNPGNSFVGPNPETLAKLEKYRKYLAELDNLEGEIK